MHGGRLGGMDRRYADPEGLWSMPVDVPYAKAVRAGGLIATCGQCPLDARGAVLAPDDPGRQAELAMGYVERVLAELGAGLADLVRLVVFHSADDEPALLARIRRRLPGPTLPSVVPVRLPYLYYPGMRIEIDAVAQLGGPRSATAADDAPFPAAVRAGGMIHTSARAAPEAGDDPLRQLDAALDALERALGALGAGLDDVVKLTTCYRQDLPWRDLARRRADRFRHRWPVISDVPLPRLGAPGAAVSLDAIALPGAPRRSVAPPDESSWPVPLPHPPALRAGPLLFIGAQSALTASGAVATPGEMVPQTRACMDRIGRLLAAEGLGFDDALKLNTFYVGAARGEDLHANLAIRSARFSRPGPASTGVPVEALPFPGAMIQVEMLAVGL